MKGYCTEVSKALIEIGFEILKLNKIYAETFNKNYGSIKVLEKLGLKLEGTRKKAVYSKNLKKYLDVFDYGLLKKEYESNSKIL